MALAVPPGEAASSRRSLDRAITTLVLVVGGLLLSMVGRADPDLWGHVRYGQDLLTERRLPATATHTFTAPDHPWINHENLAELAFAAAFEVGGVPGLTVLRGGLGLAVLGLLLAAARRRAVPLPITAVVVLLVAGNLGTWWTFRPQLFTHTSFAVMVALLDLGTAERGRRAWLWAIPLLFVLWSNAHGGFVAGFLVLTLYLGSWALGQLWQRGRAGVGQGLQAAGVMAAAGLATLVNPYGVGLLGWLVRGLAAPRPEITEWAALSPDHQQFLPLVALLALTAAGWLGSRRHRSAPQTLLLCVTAWQACAHIRHIPFFAILAGFWLPVQLAGLRERFVRPRDVAGEAPVDPPRWIGLGAWATAWVLAFGFGAKLGDLRVDRASYPVEAIEFMARHGLHGRTVVYFDWAQYAIAALAPETRVSFDGRFRTCYPQQVVDAHFDLFLGDFPDQRWRSAESPPIDPTRALEMGAPELALLSRRVPYAPGIMRGQPGWVLLYQDGLAELWGRRSRYDEPSSQHFFPPALRLATDRPQEGFARFPALPSAGAPGVFTATGPRTDSRGTDAGGRGAPL